MDHAHPCVACHRVGAHTIGCPMIPASPRAERGHCAACGGTATHAAGCPMTSAPQPTPRVYGTPATAAPVMLAVTPPGATEPTVRELASAQADHAEPQRVMRLRCPRETAATEARHVAMDVRLPLDINTLTAFVKGLKCPCGADFVLVQKGGA